MSLLAFCTAACSQLSRLCHLSPSLTNQYHAGIEAVRRVVGAGRFTARNPGSLLEYDPEAPGPHYSATHVVRHLALGYPEPRIL